jgi:hypothetical protein
MADKGELVRKTGSGRMSAFDMDAEVSESTVVSSRVLRERARARLKESLERDARAARAKQTDAAVAPQGGEAAQGPGASSTQLGVLEVSKSYLLMNRGRKDAEQLLTKGERAARRKALFEHSEANHLAGTIPNGRDPFRPASLRKLGLKSKASHSGHVQEQSSGAAGDVSRSRRRSRSFDSLTGPSPRAVRTRGSFRWVPTARKYDAIPYMEALEAWRSDDERADFWDRASREFYWRESQKMLTGHRPAFSGAQDTTVSDIDRSKSSQSLFVDSTRSASRTTGSTSQPPPAHQAVSSAAPRPGSRGSTGSVERFRVRHG